MPTIKAPPKRATAAECRRLREFLEAAGAVGADHALRKPEVLAGFWPMDRRPTRERALRAIVSAAPSHGEPVVSCNDGYYVAVTNEDVARCVADLLSRMEELRERVAALERLDVEGTRRDGLLF
jgi:hypothetical protein